MKKRLGDIVSLFYGPHKKAYETGGVKYLVSSHFDDNNKPNLFKDSYLPDTDLMNKYLLQENDLIITGKGQRVFAWAYDEAFGKTIPSSLFFILKNKVPELIDSRYLTIYINSKRVNHYLKSVSAGTSMPSIPKQQIEMLAIDIPPMEEQKRVVEVTELLNRDLELEFELIEKKKKLREGVINHFINHKNNES